AGSVRLQAVMLLGVDAVPVGEDDHGGLARIKQSVDSVVQTLLCDRPLRGLEMLASELALVLRRHLLSVDRAAAARTRRFPLRSRRAAEVARVVRRASRSTCVRRRSPGWGLRVSTGSQAEHPALPLDRYR